MTQKNCKVHNTEYIEVVAQGVTINGNIYAGHHGKSYYDDTDNPRLKSIILPIEGWTTFVTQAVPTIDKANSIKTRWSRRVRRHNSRTRPYSNSIVTGLN